MRLNRTLMACAALVVAWAGSTISASAQEPACVPNASLTEGTFDFLMGIVPSDTPLDVWCRLQDSLVGDYEMTVFYPSAEAFRTVALSFDGNARRPKGEFAAHLQSMLPISGEGGAELKPFTRVLATAVQAAAMQAPNKAQIAIPRHMDESKRFALWTPMQIVVKDVQMFGLPFEVLVTFQPSVGRFLASVDGKLENMVLQGWRRDVLSAGIVGGNGCGEYVPLCDDLPEVISLDMAWQLRSVSMRTSGTMLSAPAKSVLESILASAPETADVSSDVKRFVPTVGKGEVTVADKGRVVTAVAVGTKDGSGTAQISVVWKETERGKDTFESMLRGFGRDLRNRAVLSAAGAPPATPLVDDPR